MYGKITNYDPYVFTSTSALWILITDSNSWSQIGYLTNAGSPGSQQGFEQVSEPNDHRTFKYSMTNYQPISYYIYWNNPAGKITMGQNGGDISNTDPTNFTPGDGEASGENLNTGDQMYGGTGFKVHLSNLHIYYSGGWRPMSGTVANSASYYGNTPNGSYEDIIWDTACAG